MQLPQPQDSFTPDELDRFDVIYTKYYEHCETYDDLENECVKHMLNDGVKLIYVQEIKEMVRERFEHDNSPPYIP
tara:strand:- start:38 stop:262 length:225 start_codon:yes stop_codon:yes gene_type:complete